MKIVFYRTLLNKARNITPSERILYSFLVAKSISNLNDIFEKDGEKLDVDELVTQIKENNNTIELCKINHSKIAKELSQTRKTIIVGMNRLKELGYIGENWVYVNEQLLEQGYFELEHKEILTGELLIFYSYLYDKSQRYDYCIDTHKAKIAEQIGKTKIAVTKYLNRLYDMGLVKRLGNGKLYVGF